jgi:hypothetical protein
MRPRPVLRKRSKRRPPPLRPRKKPQRQRCRTPQRQAQARSQTPLLLPRLRPQPHGRLAPHLPPRGRSGARLWQLALARPPRVLRLARRRQRQAPALLARNRQPVPRLARRLRPLGRRLGKVLPQVLPALRNLRRSAPHLVLGQARLRWLAPGHLRPQPHASLCRRQPQPSRHLRLRRPRARRIRARTPDNSGPIAAVDTTFQLHR